MSTRDKVGNIFWNTVFFMVIGGIIGLAIVAYDRYPAAARVLRSVPDAIAAVGMLLCAVLFVAFIVARIIEKINTKD